LLKKKIVYYIDTWIEEEFFAKVPHLIGRSLPIPLEKKFKMIFQKFRLRELCTIQHMFDLTYFGERPKNNQLDIS
jgi:hypothetical protein